MIFLKPFLIRKLFSDSNDLRSLLLSPDLIHTAGAPDPGLLPSTTPPWSAGKWAAPPQNTGLRLKVAARVPSEELLREVEALLLPPPPQIYSACPEDLTGGTRQAYISNLQGCDWPLRSNTHTRTHSLTYTQHVSTLIRAGLCSVSLHTPCVRVHVLHLQRVGLHVTSGPCESRVMLSFRAEHKLVCMCVQHAHACYVSVDMPRAPPNLFVF